MNYTDMIKLKNAEDLVTSIEHDDGHWADQEYYRDDIIRVIKEAQKEAVEKTLQVASENAEADYNITESFDRLTGEDIEVYVINSSILNLKEQIFKDNNL